MPYVNNVATAKIDKNNIFDKTIYWILDKNAKII